MTHMVSVESPRVTSGTLSRLIICCKNSDMFSMAVSNLIYSYIIRSFFNNKRTIKCIMYPLKWPYEGCDQHRRHPEQDVQRYADAGKVKEAISTRRVYHRVGLVAYGGGEAGGSSKHDGQDECPGI